MACTLNILTRIGIGVVTTFRSRAVVDAGNVSNEHVGKLSLAANDCSRVVSLLLSTNNLSWPTVHVEIAVANVVDPKPSNSVLAGCHFIENGVLEGRSTAIARARAAVTYSGTGARHPPSIDVMTIHLEILVGSMSVVKLTWQEPVL